MGTTTYKFRWDNQDLAEYMRGRSLVANQYRADARALMLKADVIDGEMLELEINLRVQAEVAEAAKP